MIKLTLSLPCPQNRRQRPSFGKGKPFLYLSKECREKRKRMVAEIHQQLGGKPEPMTRDCQMTFIIYPATKKLPDLDAYTKELLDGLAQAGVVANDRQVIQISKERLTPDYPGRIELELWEIV